MNLTDKVCLITGGTRGIGAATARSFAKAGASVALVARRVDETAVALKSEIVAMGQRCLLISADLARGQAAAD